MRVQILGGGVAGLGCALALIRRAQIQDVCVLERQSAERFQSNVGHGLILMQNGVQALGALDALHILDGCTKLRRMLIQDGRGAVLHADTFDDVYCVTRAQIIDGLRASLPEGVMILDHLCERVELTTRGRRRGQDHVRAVRLRDRPLITRETIDLLIGADGWRSVLCEALNPGYERPQSRVHEIVTSTTLPVLAGQIGNVFIKTVFPDRAVAFGLLAPTPERVIAFLQFDAERYGSPGPRANAAECGRLLHALLDGAPEPVPTYLKDMDLKSAHLWCPPNADLPPRLHCANAVLIGDAAHPLLPFTSQGVGAALEDAVILADRIAPLRDDPAALAGVLAGFAEKRRQHLTPYVEGGRRILAGFLDTARGFDAPYLDGAISALERYLTVGDGYLRNLFQILDRDGDGCLDRAGFHDAMELFEFDLSREEKNALFEEIDSRGDGTLDITEVLAAFGGDKPASPLLQRLRAARSPRRVQLYHHHRRLADLFRLLDHDDDGAVDFEDFSVAAAMEGIVLSAEALRRRFDALDADGDGRITVRDLSADAALADGSPSLARLVELERKQADPFPADDDPLFAAGQVDIATLRVRAWNYRWAVQPEGVIPLTAADPDFPVADEILDALHEYLRPGYLSYGPAEGLPDLRAAAALRFRKRRNLDCTDSNIFVTNSAASALYLVAQYALGLPGAEALVADPCDFLFERAVSAAGGIVRRYRLDPTNGYSFDQGEIENLITPRTRLLTVCNPHNPLGRVWRRDELEALAQIALRHDLWILSDEVWADIVFPPHQFISVGALGPEIARRTFTIYGFSKGYALAGLRVGLVISPDAQQHQALVRASHADETAYGVSTLSQIAGIAAFERAEGWLERFVTHLQRQRDRAVTRLNQMDGVRCHVPEGTFVVFPDVSGLGRDVDEIAESLRRHHGVAVVPGSPAFFGPAARGHVRLSIATSRQLLSEGLDRLESGFGALKRSS